MCRPRCASLQQQTDAPIITDGEYFGYSGPALTATWGPPCQLRISLAQLRDVQDIMDLYNRFYLQLGLALAAHGCARLTAGRHPTCHAEDLPLVPPHPDEAMDAYLREKGACSVQMMQPRRRRRCPLTIRMRPILSAKCARPAC